MTIASALNRKTFAGDDATTSFATTPIKFFETSDLLVYVTNDTTGIASLKTEGTHYTVSGGDEDAGATGTVSLAGGSVPHGALLSGTTLVVVRELPLLQGVDFVQNDASNAEVAEAALDKIVMNAQRLDDRLDRSLVVSDGDISGANFTVPTPEASALLGWASDAMSIVNYELTDLDITAVPAYALDIITAADDDAFFATMVDGMTAETAPAVGDLLALVDVSLTPDDGRKMTLANMLAVVNGLTADSAPVAATDYLMTYDTSAAAVKKALLSLIGPPIGSVQAYIGTTAPTGWLLLYGGTIGNAASSGTARANADTETLYTLLWNSMADGQAAVSTGRGANAAADFAANKTIALPDLRGRVVAGYDSMGGSSANRLTDLSGGLDGDVQGDTGGAETHVLTTAQLAAHTHTQDAHAHVQRIFNNGGGVTGGAAGTGGSGSANDTNDPGSTVTAVATNQNTGSDAAHNNVQPTFILSYIVKY